MTREDVLEALDSHIAKSFNSSHRYLDVEGMGKLLDAFMKMQEQRDARQIPDKHPGFREMYATCEDAAVREILNGSKPSGVE